MATKEMIKAQIDKLPEEWLDAIYAWLTTITKTARNKKKATWKTRSFQGKLDNVDLRREAYE